MSNHPLNNTLINLKEFRDNLSEYNTPPSDEGWSLSNIPDHFWETLGEVIKDIELHIEKDKDE